MKEITRDMFPKEIRNCCRESAHTLLAMHRCPDLPCHSCFMDRSNLSVGNNDSLCCTPAFNRHGFPSEDRGEYVVRVAKEYLELIKPCTKLDLTE